MNFDSIKYDLIVTIVNKGKAEEVVKHIKKAGAQGSTIINGRGTGNSDAARLFGIVIEPEKEIILTIISDAKTNDVLQALYDKLRIDEPGNGVAFVLDISKCMGIHCFDK